MAKKTLPYREGTWFAVPLRTNGFALGVVARLDGDGTVWGYFFGPPYDSVPSCSATEGLEPQASIAQERFGDLGLIEGEWPIVGESITWDRSGWPLPDFVRADREEGWAWKVVYSDKDLSPVSEEPCDISLADSLPRDSLAGSGAVELVLTHLLKERSGSSKGAT